MTKNSGAVEFRCLGCSQVFTLPPGRMDLFKLIPHTKGCARDMRSMSVLKADCDPVLFIWNERVGRLQ